MIELETQFQIVIGSVLFGMFLTSLYKFIDIMLGKSKVFRLIVESCFFLTSSLGYYCFIYVINKGILTVYMPVCLLLGYYLYMKFYDKYFSCLYEYLFSKFHSIIKKKKDRWKKRWRELKSKIIKKEKSTE